MIGLPAGTRVWLAAGVTDMRRYVQLNTMLSCTARIVKNYLKFNWLA